MNNNKEDLFTCPNCGESFTLAQWVGHNQVVVNKFLATKANEIVKEKEKEIIKQKDAELESKIKSNEVTYKTQINQINLNNAKVINGLESAIKEKDIALKNLTDNQAREIATSKVKAENEFKDQINVLKQTIADLNNKLSTLEKDANTKLTNLTLQKNSEFESKMKTNEVTYKAQINQINIDNSKKISSLEGIIKEKDIALKNLTDNQVKEIEISKVKIENQYKDKLNYLNENITSLKNTLESTIAQKDSDKELTVAKLTQEYSDKLSKKNEEISTLKQLNSENRIIQNKTKGENWEREVENALCASFDYYDKIEKINNTVDAQKADYLQVVRDPNKNEIGRIVYEVKNAHWSDAWIPKLVQDAANSKAKYGILVTANFSDKFHLDVGFKKSDDYDNIWIADPLSFIFVAQIIRKMIEVENGFEVAKKKLTDNSNAQMYQEYMDTVDKLKDYMSFQLPNYIKSFKKELGDLEKIENSLNSNATKISKLRIKMEKDFNKEVKTYLEKISNQRVIFEEELDVKNKAGIPENNIINENSNNLNKDIN